LQKTARPLDQGSLERAAHTLARASRIDIYGVGKSWLTAAETEARLVRLGCCARSWSEVHAATASAAALTSADAALGLGNSGSTREVYDAPELARRWGATTIAVTDDPSSPLAQLADISLLFTESAISVGDRPVVSRHSQMLIVDLLHVRVAQHIMAAVSPTDTVADVTVGVTDVVSPQHRQQG